MMCRLLALIFLLAISIDYSEQIFGTLQNLCVKGQLKCRTDPREAAFVRIKLWDEDTGSFYF